MSLLQPFDSSSQGPAARCGTPGLTLASIRGSAQRQPQPQRQQPADYPNPSPPSTAGASSDSDVDLDDSEPRSPLSVQSDASAESDISVISQSQALDLKTH